MTNEQMAELKEFITATVRKAVQETVFTLGWGYNPEGGFIQDTPSWKKATSTYNLKALAEQAGTVEHTHEVHGTAK